ncbi:Isochorismatase hydrolase [Dunaliella salina]|uniref:Isochorismatase hydrolase n=1 Tax=Dunaliella salina TaxID=3046 RepID=A0ABQ7G4K6_DUNSA|nr:Isochorismatase hydrolase [Dunaliella salina]|eukprot:KAF5829543.1 Isochorismatase hydrolase [Dunaliella salina]
MRLQFRNVITGYPSLMDTTRRTLRGATTLGMPVVATEQYPKALGHTAQELMEVMPPPFPPAGSPPPPVGTSHHRVFEKTLFSMMTPEVDAHMTQNLGHVKQVLLLGIEAHVCVLQTTLDLLERGMEVHLLVDGISSQKEHDRAVALQRMANAGAFLCTSEMALFQLTRDAKAPTFKAISALAKEPKPQPFMSLRSNL